MTTFETRPLDNDQTQRFLANNAKANEMLACISDGPKSREMSLAITKLEECVMWANKAISRETK